MSRYLDSAACLDAQRARDLAANDIAMRAELQALADQIAARRSFVGPQILRTGAAHCVSASPYVRTCVLCKGPSDRTTCAGCDAMYSELGL